MVERGLDSSGTPLILTYYEICMTDQGPITDPCGHEFVDLRETLDYLSQRPANQATIELRVKVSRDELRQLLAASNDPLSPWIEMIIRLSPEESTRDEGQESLE